MGYNNMNKDELCRRAEDELKILQSRNMNPNIKEAHKKNI